MTAGAGAPGSAPGDLRLDPAAFTVAPGGTAETAVRFDHSGEVVEQYTLAVDGLEPTWWELDPESLSLFPGDSAASTLRLRIPEGAAPGAYAFRVTVTPRTAGAGAGVDGRLEVSGAVERVELSLAPARQHTRRRATFVVRVANRGTGAASYRLIPGDPDAALRFSLRPEDVSLDPGLEVAARLDVWVRHTSLTGPQRSFPLTVAAARSDDPLATPLAESGAELVRRPYLPFLAAVPQGLARLALLGAGLAALLAVLAWVLGGAGGKLPAIVRPGGGDGDAVAQATAAAAGGADARQTAAAAAAAPGAAGGGAQSGAAGSAAATQAALAAARPPSIARFGLSLPADGESVPLSWDVQHTSNVVLRREGDPAARSPVYQTVERVEYTLEAQNDAGRDQRTLTVYYVRPPAINAFGVDGPAGGDAGDALRLSWATERGDRVFLDGQPIDAAASNAARALQPDRDYELRVENLAGEARQTLRITSTPAPTPTPPPAATQPPAAPTSTPGPPPAQPTAVPPPAGQPTARPPQPTAPPAPPGGNPGGGPGGGPGGPGVVTARQPLRGDRFGVNESFFASALARGTGATWSRWVVEWSEMQPGGAGDFNTFYIDDAALNREIGNGIRMSGMIKNTPGWAQRSAADGVRSVPLNLDAPVFVGNTINPDNYWGAFVFRLASSYRGRIDTWMIWNEAEIPSSGPNAVYNTWTGTPAEYYRLLKVAYQAIKAANPQARVVLTPYSYFRDKETGGGQTLPWWEQFVAAARADPEGPANGFFFDVLALNLYRNAHDLWDRVQGACSLQDNPQLCLTSTAADDDYVTERADRRGFSQRLTELGAPGKPIWLTEANAMPYDDGGVPGWNPAGRNDGFRITQDEQASFVIQSLAIASVAGYERISWHKMQDDRPPPPDELWGLARYADDPLNASPARLRPAYTAYQVATRYLADAEWAQMANLTRPDSCARPRDANLRPCHKRFAARYEWAANYIAFQRTDRRVHVLWNQTDQPMSVSVPRYGQSAVAVDKAGAETPLAPAGDRWAVTLPPASRHFDLFGGDPPGYFYIGGSPILIVESGVPADAPVLVPLRG
jgi:hypothetical protein